MSLANEKAFPMSYEPGRDYSDQSGLTIRQHFAIQALQGLMACGRLHKVLAALDVEDLPKSMAEMAVDAADALIKRLEESK